MNILYVFVSLIIGFFIGRSTKKSFGLQSKDELEEAHSASRKALAERTENRKEEIIEMMKNSRERYEELKACNLVEERKGIHRGDVEDLLEVSTQTALKYLNELEEEGKIKQIGNSGKDVYYMLSI
ncbi:MAG: hypothetical protein MRY49_00135 [Candidatus Pacebacteria bacterium]|nr:hypothetical protein [Candidatus Paceibacterota bacterium]